MKFVDLRLPYESSSEKADTIREGIKRLIKKFGVNLNEIKILQHESWFLAEGVIDHLKFVPKTISKLVAKNKTSSLAELLTNLVSDTMTVKKQSCIGLSDTWIDSLLKEMDAFDESIITGIKQDLSAVGRLDICIEDPLNIDLLVKFCNFFSNLKLISLNFGEIFGTFLDTSYVPKMIDLLDRTDSKVCIELSHSLVLTEPVYIAGLRYYLDRLKIDSETEHLTFEVYTRVDDYEEVEAVLRRHLPPDKIEDYLRSLCRVKTIQEQIDSDEELENSMKCIAFHGKYTEKIHLNLGDIDKDGDLRKRIVDCVVNNCPNLKQLKLTVIRNCDEDVLDLINRKGRLLEYLDIMIEMGDPLSLDIFAAIVDNCPNLKTLKLNGMLPEYHDDLMKFHHRFREMHKLDFVKIRPTYGSTRPALVYCNGKMALVT
ncbi:hypothetical protein HDE_12816 [Halotydeus destructor]|nr:hypothetical protein HDE_12816 [Halotydeus destructor]